MTDPWEQAANNITERRNNEAREREAAERTRRLQEDAQRAEANRAYNELQIAINSAVPLLTAFLEQRGAAAQRLLAAHSDRAAVIFGSRRGGGEFSSVYLSKDGLRHEVGTGGDYGTTPIRNRAATPQEAVRAFAYHGQGCRNPSKVRDIVTWLTQSMERYTH